jgi:hypothetical protein
MSLFDERLERGRRQWGEKFDPACLVGAPDLIRQFNTDARVEVDVYGDGEVIECGRVSTTQGWAPSFLLMRRRSDRGSSYLLDKRTKIRKVVSA